MVEDSVNTASSPAQAVQPRRIGTGAMVRRKRTFPRSVQTAAPAEPGEAAGNVVQIVQPSPNETRKKKLHRDWPWLSISVFACIALPVALAALYYFVIAADQYVSEARFAVRSNSAQAADVLGMISGAPASSVVSDSYIVADYIRSVEMVSELERRLPLRAFYADERGDFLSRLDPTVSREDLVSYWDGRVDVSYDSTKNTIAVRVRAFDPEHARRIVADIVEISRKLVNELSAQARRDQVRFASAEVARAELRVRGARDDILQFQTANNEFDPAQTATSTLGIVAQLEAERSQLNSRLMAVSGYLDEKAPSVQMLRSRIDAIDVEIARKQGELSTSEAASTESGQPGPLATVVAKYQQLLMDQEFAQQAYTAALASLERARTEADRTQSYLAIYLNPTSAESATYPTAFLNTVIVLALACVLWAIGALGFLAIRDHVR